MAARWYQHVLTGEKVRVTTLDEDDQYNGVSVWSRIPAPPEPEKKPAVKKAAVKKQAD